MIDYLHLCKDILTKGTVVPNERTGYDCTTLINADLTYDVDEGKFPMVTTRRAYWKSAIAELLGYIRGYSDAKDFQELGAPTWLANANENEAWLNNPNRKGPDDMGRVYGVQGRSWIRPDGHQHDQLAKIVENLSNGIDDRGEILSFYNPGEFDQGCLRPCMHTHQFSLVGDTLHLHSFQRSCDVPLGLVANMMQCYVLLALMAEATGHKPGKAYHKIVNAHIYSNQVELMEEQLGRFPYDPPTLLVPKTKDLGVTGLDYLECVEVEDFDVKGYVCHPPIKYPFAV